MFKRERNVEKFFFFLGKFFRIEINLFFVMEMFDSFIFDVSGGN